MKQNVAGKCVSEIQTECLEKRTVLQLFSSERGAPRKAQTSYYRLQTTTGNISSTGKRGSSPNTYILYTYYIL